MKKKDYLVTDDIITLVAKKKHFAKADVKDILEGFIEVFEELVSQGIIFKMRRFGQIKYQIVPARYVKAYTNRHGESFPAKDLPQTVKVLFKLAENIRMLRVDGISPEEDLEESETLDTEEEV